MNAAVRVLHFGVIRWKLAKRSVLLNKCNAVIALVAILVVFSAFAVAYSKDVNRRLFMQQQTLLAQYANEQSEWTKLLLEESTWASQARIQSIASQKLGMVLPNARNIVLVRMPTHAQ